MMRSDHRQVARHLPFAVVLTLAAAYGHTVDYDGGALYAANCSSCHGIYGEGDGDVTPDLAVVLLDLRYLSARNDGAFPAAFVRDMIDGRERRAAHGGPAMPVWGAEFARSEGFDAAAAARVDEKIGALVRFLESIQVTE